MRSFIFVFIMVIFAVGMTACGGDSSDSNTNVDDNTTQPNPATGSEWNKMQWDKGQWK